jgi:hypothetical protein
MVLNKYKNILFIVVVFFILAGCSKSPQYPAAPQIEFVEAKKIALSNGIDSLYIKLKFKDGDGNLGLNAIDPPTKEYVQGDTVRNLPLDQWDCQKYLSVNGDRDTITITRNPNYFNFFVSFYKKNSNNTYTLIDRPDCRQNNGRFSRFDPDNNYSGPLEGTIEWNFKGSFSEEFKNMTIQIGIFIQDRSFNKSNVAYTQDIKF